MNLFNSDINLKFVPSLDKAFKPAAVMNRKFQKAVEESGAKVPLAIALERGEGLVSTYNTFIFDDNHPDAESNLFYVERIVKTLLWQKGGYKVIIGG